MRRSQIQFGGVEQRLRPVQAEVFQSFHTPPKYVEIYVPVDTLQTPLVAILPK